MTTETPKRQRGPLGFALAAIFNFFVLLVLNAYEVWRPWLGGVVTETFSQVLWAANLACVVQIFGNLILYVTSPWWLRRLADLAFALSTLVAVIVFYQVYPLDLARFGPLPDVLGHLVLFLGIVGATIAIFVTLVRLASGKGSQLPPPHPSHP